MSHKLVRVYVNAWVDEGIAPLVRALSRFPRLISTAGCEDVDGDAVVAFDYGDYWWDTVRFCLWLADELASRLEEAASISLSCGPYLTVTANLHVQRSAIERVTAELDAIAYRWGDDPQDEICRRFPSLSLRNGVVEVPMPE